MFFLFNIIIAIGLGIVLGILKAATNIDLTFLGGLYSLALFCPGIAVGVRRLHDSDRTGLWMLIAFVPFLGAIALLVLVCMEGTAADNRFGPSPIKAISDTGGRF